MAMASSNKKRLFFPIPQDKFDFLNKIIDSESIIPVIKLTTDGEERMNSINLGHFLNSDNYVTINDITYNYILVTAPGISFLLSVELNENNRLSILSAGAEFEVQEGFKFSSVDIILCLVRIDPAFIYALTANVPDIIISSPTSTESKT